MTVIIGVELTVPHFYNKKKSVYFYILFLTVLNHELFYEEQSQCERNKKLGYPLGDLDPTRIELVNEIVDKTGCEVIISSTWRKSRFNQLQELFEKCGFKYKISGRTPSLYFENHNRMSVPRGCEIENYIDTCYDWDMRKYVNYAILDDDSDMLLHQASHFFHVDPYAGLTHNIAYKVINFLNREV